jgi:D-beta-D-heptose 7-phosphate kinase/D-beta-D-heptose 1-phosphate adenosyltransferase
MVLAALGLGRAAGLRLEEAARLANTAAGLEVERPGVSVVTRAELRAHVSCSSSRSAKIVDAETLAKIGASHRKAGRRLVFTNGCFDLLHAGHIACLEEAAGLGDILIVAINSDASVRALKGAGRPAVSESDRAALLAALASVDHVIIFEESTPQRLLELIRPDVLVKGGTYDVERVVGHEFVESYGGRVIVTGRVEGRSTTELITRLARTGGA